MSLNNLSLSQKFVYISCLETNIFCSPGNDKTNSIDLINSWETYVAELVKKFPNFMETESSLPSSQEPAIDSIFSQMNPHCHI